MVDTRAPHGTINGVPIIGPLNEHEYLPPIDELYEREASQWTAPLSRRTRFVAPLVSGPMMTPAMRVSPEALLLSAEPVWGLASVLDACGEDDCAECRRLFRDRSRAWFERLRCPSGWERCR